MMVSLVAIVILAHAVGECVVVIINNSKYGKQFSCESQLYLTTLRMRSRKVVSAIEEYNLKCVKL